MSLYWLLLTAFVGLNLLQSAFTGFCPAAILLRRLGLEATVIIDRDGGRAETLILTPVVGNRHAFMSAVAPAEPHEFEAQLRLEARGQKDVLSLRMAEPEGHSH